MTMQIPATIAGTAREGADSVFAYVERTAEAGPDGVRWRTLSYENAYYYDASPYNGTGGIPLFLADYHRLTGNARALEQALGGARWCLAAERTFTGDRGPALDGMLWFGRAGIGMVWLLLAEVAGDADLLVHARTVGDRAAAMELGAVTDYIGGVAGRGVFLVRLWEATHDTRYLAAAISTGEWLEAHATRDAVGCHWPVQVGGAGGTCRWASPTASPASGTSCACSTRSGCGCR